MRTRTSPGPGSGSGRSTRRSTSGSPDCEYTTALIHSSFRVRVGARAGILTSDKRRCDGQEPAIIFVTRNDLVAARAYGVDLAWANGWRLTMTRIERRIVIDRPVEAVFGFVHDAANDARWQTTIVESRVLTPGPTGIGTRVAQVRRFLGVR